MEKEYEYCDKCGSKLIFAVSGNCCGAKCPKCNVFKTVSTYINPAEEDGNEYELYIIKTDYSAKKAYGLAKKLNCDVNSASDLLRKERTLAFKGKAIKIVELIEFFQKNNINYDAPNFPYK